MKRVKVWGDLTKDPIYHRTPTRRILVISGNGYVKQFKELLATTLTKDVEEAYNNFMYRMVECLRYRDKAGAELSHVLQSLELNLKQINHTRTDEFVKIVSDISEYLLGSFKDNRMYAKDGVLDYTYLKHPDKNFEDFLFGDVLRLPYERKGKSYERRR